MTNIRFAAEEALPIGRSQNTSVRNNLPPEFAPLEFRCPEYAVQKCGQWLRKRHRSRLTTMRQVVACLVDFMVTRTQSATGWC